MQQLAAEHDVRPVWLGLATARMAAGDAAAAAAAMAKALSAQVGAVEPGFAALADSIARANGASGWCALAGHGVLRFGRAAPERPLALTLDGRLVVPMPLTAGGEVGLPAGWEHAGRLDVAIDGDAVLGSPIDLAWLRRAEGFVACRDGGIEGWAWLPADPEADPMLRVVPRDGGPGLRVRATDAGMETAAAQLLARPRRFRLGPERLGGLCRPLRVIGPDGRDLLGSPLDPAAERESAAALARSLARRSGARGSAAAASLPALAAVPADIIGPKSPSRLRRKPPGVSVIVPVYGGRELSLHCLAEVRATVPRGTRIIVVDDASPDRDLAAALDRLATAGAITLIRSSRNRGFPASANAGLRAAAETDAILLNSDALVGEHWVERLRAAAYAAPDIGTATPLSNDATILSYPSIRSRNPMPAPAETRRLAALAHRANGGQVVEIPTAIGFCMYIRRDCLDAVGLFREDVFAQGYGEENDFCLRARHLGWRHVAACGVFVAHVGGQSFGAARTHLLARNLAMLNRLHPGYDALIAEHIARDPLAEARRRLDMARWRAARRPGNRASVLLMTHDRGGGVQRQIEARMAALGADGLRPIVLLPVGVGPEPAYRGLCRIDDGSDAYPNLTFALPGELGAMARFLRGERVLRAELHHLLGHDHAVLDLVARLGVPYDAHIHDYAWFCPRIALLGPDHRYCGEPDVATCEACVRDAGRATAENIPVAALRARSATDLAEAERVIAPSADAAARIARHFPGISPLVVPWEADPPRPERALADAPPGGERRVCVIGAIGREKGYDVLLACARDAARRDLPLGFVVVGYTFDDARLLETGRVFITGEYEETEASALIAAQRPHLAFLPSIWPETWCFALSAAWRAGLHVVAFDIGAPAERIRRYGLGTVLPLGLPPAPVNQALLTAGAAVAKQPKPAAKARFTLRTAPAITEAANAPIVYPITERTESEISRCPKPPAPP